MNVTTKASRVWRAAAGRRILTLATAALGIVAIGVPPAGAASPSHLRVLQTFPFPSNGGGIATDLLTSKTYVSDGNFKLGVVDDRTNHFSIIHGVGGCCGTGGAVASDDAAGTLLLDGGQEENLLLFSVRTHHIRQLSVEGDDAQIGVDQADNKYYLSDGVFPGIDVIDGVTGFYEGSIRLPFAAYTTGDLLVDPKTEQLYAAVTSYRNTQAEYSIAVIDLRTRRMVARISEPKMSPFLAPAIDNSRNILYYLHGSGVTVVDGNTQKIKESIPLPPTSGFYDDLAVDPGAGKLFILHSDNSQTYPYKSHLLQIDLRSKSVEEDLRVGDAAIRLSIDPRRHALYVSTFYAVQVVSEGSPSPVS